MKQRLTLDLLRKEARAFAELETKHDEPSLFGVTDGKAVGTYLEQKFTHCVGQKYEMEAGNSASGIDFPKLDVDIKVTSIKQPQSSCPFRAARQKIYGLGYHLLIFVYSKSDDETRRTSRLDMRHTIFVDKSKTADYQLTNAIRAVLEAKGNDDDLVALFADKNLPVDDITAQQLAEEVIRNPPDLGYLTISNALQWRLQYKRVIDHAGSVEGLSRIF
jgi:hypothetical protein